MQNKTFASRMKGWLIKAAIIVAAAVGLAIVVAVAFNDASNYQTGDKPPVVVEATPTSQPVATVAVQQRDIVVTPQTIKQVDGKYRYFFDIRNQDTEPFSGTVKIQLVTAGGLTVGTDTFESGQPMEPGLGASVYLDTNTGPATVHGSAGVTEFTYVVSIDEASVNSGQGDISD